MCRISDIIGGFYVAYAFDAKYRYLKFDNGFEKFSFINTQMTHFFECESSGKSFIAQN